MATTKIWGIKHYGGLIKVADYTTKEAKTTFVDPKSAEDFVISAMSHRKHTNGLQNLLGYTIEDEKTHQQKFVTALNCTEENAVQTMQDTKEVWGKADGIMAFHGIQAFKPGETTPELAHKIGVALAEKLWGDRFEVVVSTHLDQKHLHNHFVLNSVSFADGLKFYDNHQSYRRMRIESDKLCVEHGLSVVAHGNPENGWHVGKRTGKSYAEYKAEKEGKPTLRGTVKTDMDTAIAKARTEDEVWRYLKELGYTLKFGQDVTVTPPGWERGVKLVRNFGEDYSKENIRQRIVAERLQSISPSPLSEGIPTSDRKPPQPPQRKPPPKPTAVQKKTPYNSGLYFIGMRPVGLRLVRRRYRLFGRFSRLRKISGFRAMYYRYLHLLRWAFSQQQVSADKPQSRMERRTYLRYSKDLLQLHKYTSQIKLLVREKIDTSEQLDEFKERCASKMSALTDGRQALRNTVRRLEYQQQKNKLPCSVITVELETTKQEIAEITVCLKALRKDVKLCDEIAENSKHISAQLNQRQKIQKQNSKNLERKEKAKHRE